MGEKLGPTQELTLLDFDFLLSSMTATFKKGGVI